MSVAIDVYPLLFLLCLLAGCAIACGIRYAVAPKQKPKDPDPIADYANERLADLDSREVCCLVAQAITEKKSGYGSTIVGGTGSIYLPGIEFCVGEFSCYAKVGERRTVVSGRKLQLLLSILKGVEDRQAVDKAREVARQGEIL